MWVKPSEQQFLFSFLNKTAKVLEWGSGQSTLEMSENVKSILSIEHNLEWYNKILPQMSSNTTLKHIPTNKPWLSVDGSLDEFYDYIQYPLSYGPFDIIYIDGRARVECSKIALQLSHKDTLIFWHDFGPLMRQDDGTWREHYNVALKWLDVVDSVETMYLFKPQ